MAMQFDLVSPERKLASFEATEVQIPGSEGDMTAMEDHMPVITTLRPGIVRAKSASGEEEFVVAGGFAEITAKSISVLAEVAAPRAEVTAEFFDAMHLSDKKDEKTSGELDQTYKQAADIEALRAELGV